MSNRDGALASLPRARLAVAAAVTCLALAPGCRSPERGPAKADPEPEAVRRNTLGAAMMSRSDPAEAVRHFRAAIEVDPGLEAARVNLGIALLAQGETAEATGVLEEAVAHDASLAGGWYVLGLARHRQGDRDGALAAFERAHVLQPDDAATLFRLGQIRASLDDAEGARRAYEQALALRPQFLSAIHALGMLEIRLGRAEEGRVLVERAQALRESGLGEPLGEAYGEQGPLALVADPAGGPERPPPLAAPAFAAEAPAGPWSSGAAVLALAALDVERDGVLELLVGHDRGWTLLGQPSSRGFEVAAEGGTAPVVGFLPADVLNAGRPVALALTGGPEAARSGLGVEAIRLVVAEGAPKLEGIPGRIGGPWSAGLAPPERGGASPAPPAGGAADLDHDGDLDLVLAAPTAAGDAFRLHVFRNLGEGRFEEVAAAAGLDAPFAPAAGERAGPPVTSVVFLDFDQDRDLDLLAVAGAQARLYSNLRDGTFRDIAAEVGLIFGASPAGVAAGDLDGDGWTDLAVAEPAAAATGHAGRLVLRGSRGGSQGRRLERLGEPPATDAPLGHLVAADYDGDGWTDLLARSAGAAPVVAFRNPGAGTWAATAGAIPASAPAAPGLGPMIAADLDGDGRLDLAYAGSSGGPAVLWNDGVPGRRGLTLDLEGVVSSRQGLGARVEIRAGRLFNQQWPSVSGSLAAPTPGLVTFGLGDRPAPDAVRVLWPNGVLQDEVDVAAGGRVALKQVDRKGTSCPILYAWDGSDYAFVTDFLGGCAVGYYLAPGVWSVPDTDEWIKVDGERLRETAGELRLLAVNQLEEVILFDAFRLLAVDHPAPTEVHPRERLLPGPPYEPFRSVVVRDARPPAAAWDDLGRDVLGLVRENDGRWPDDYPRLRPKGYAGEHALVLDLGDAGDSGEILLLLDGWIDYADSAANLAAAQAGLRLVPPRLEARDASGRWAVLDERMGFPAGLPKTMVVPIAAASFPSRERVVRIATTMRIAWDRVRVATGGGPATTTELPLLSADLRFVGYPAETQASERGPRAYDWSRRAAIAPWKAHAGRYTRFGPVEELLRAVDDRYAITRHGDGIALAFDAAAAPPLAPGWTRDYYLFADGFGKDMDPISAVPWTVEPLPWHAMSAYPPPPGEAFPDLERLGRDLAEYHTRAVHDVEPARLTVARDSRPARD